jgi:hypothetical protein
MGIYDNFNDTPNKIEKEGQEITLTFTRNGDGTANVCWNIPPPMDGCTTENQAYDGIVVTVSSKPSNYISTSPKDGTYYNYDPTANADLHLADKLDYAYIVGAFYHDKTTTCVVVTDIEDKTPYYFSAYAVDKVGRYHREGVHAYSIPLTQQKHVDDEDKPAYHDIVIDYPTPINGNTLTGLLSNSMYSMTFTTNGKCYDLSVRGSESMTYNALVIALNKEFGKLSTDIWGPNSPYYGKYYVDINNKKLYMWDGDNHEQILNVVFWDNNPQTPLLGTYWYNYDTDELYYYESGGWMLISSNNIIKYYKDPRQLECDDIWFDGSTIWQWDGSIWCELPTYIQLRNPLLPPDLDCTTYWYDTTTDEFKAWDDELSIWQDELVMVYEKDPNDITTGDFWYNETDSKVYIYLTGAYNELNNVRYEEPNSNGDIDNPVANHYWYNTIDGTLFKRNVSNTAWVEKLIVSYPTDPTNRESCNLWWDTSFSINTLYKWDEVNNEWSIVVNFYESDIDPSLPKLIEENAAWYNPETDAIELILGMNCLPVKFIYSLLDPTSTNIGDIWFNTTLSTWNEWTGAQWVTFVPIEKTTDPFIINVDDYWFNLNDNTLNRWGGLTWINTEYSLNPIVPLVGELWWDTVNEILLEWNGTKWIQTNPFVYATLVLEKGTCLDGYDILRFQTKGMGCEYSLKINPLDNIIIGSLSIPVLWFDEVVGTSAIDARYMSDQLGVGTDGSPDERRELHSIIRATLGKIGVEVELTKEQIDIAIDNALKNVRKYSSYATKRGYFFLDTNPNQQHYRLTDKCVGFNKISFIKAIYRTGPFNYGGRGGTMNGDNSVFSYTALQQLYSLQTFDILSYHLVAQYLEQIEHLFARKIMFQWNKDTRVLHIFQANRNYERVLVDAYLERPEQELIKDSALSLWIQRWAIAESKMILSQVRGKYQTLPGPNGSTTLNSQELITQSENEKADLMAEIYDPVMQNLIDDGLNAHMIIG